MPNPADLQNKFLNLPPGNPWPSIPGTRFLSGLMADIDADGCAEIVALSPECPGLSVAGLGILSYFDYTALANSFPAPQPPQLLATGGMGLSETQIVTPVTVRGVGQVDLMIVDQANQYLGLYSWIENALASRWATSPNVYGTEQWVLEAGNKFFLGDIDGDGAQEIIALSNSTGASDSAPAGLAVFKWINNSEIRVIWTAPGGIVTGNGGANWNVYSADQFYVGDINGDGVAEILAFDGNSFLGAMTWNAGAGQLQVNWIVEGSVPAVINGVGSWTISTNDWYHLADINGDGKQEVVASNGTQLGVFEWNGTELVTIGINSGLIPASGQSNWWPIGVGDIHHIGNIQSTSFASIVVFNPAIADIGPQIGILRWVASSHAFVTDWTATGTITSTNGQSWKVGADNGLARADVDADGILEIAVQSDSESALGYLKWNGAALDPVWTWSTASSGSPPVQGWGVGVIATAPATPFSWPVNTNQQTIYNDVCSSLTKDTDPTDDLRSLYWNNQISTNLIQYASDLDDALSGLGQSQPVYYWPWMSQYSMGDLQSVLNTLATEFQAIPDIWTFDTNMDAFLQSLLKQQQTDLETVQTNLLAEPPSSDTSSYWAGQIFEAAIWAVAALPLGVAMQATMAAAASLFGSVIGQVNTAPDSVGFNAISNLLITNCQNATDAVDAMVSNHTANPPTGVVTDQVKIPLIGKYVFGIAGWNSNQTDMVAASSTNYNRTTFYQQLMAQVYQVNVYLNVVDPTLLWLSPPLGTLPGYASQTTTDPTSSTVQVIMQPEWGRFNTPLFPTTTLISDLTSLGFALSDVLNGEPPLNLSQVNSGNSFQSEGCYIYTTNQTIWDVWITIYDSLGRKLSWGMVNPGQTVIWNDQIWWDTTYKVKGELKNGSKTICETSVHVNPSNGESGSSFSGYAISILQGSTNCYFNHLN